MAAQLKQRTANGTIESFSVDRGQKTQIQEKMKTLPIPPWGFCTAQLLRERVIAYGVRGFSSTTWQHAATQQQGDVSKAMVVGVEVMVSMNLKFNVEALARFVVCGS